MIRVDEIEWLEQVKLNERDEIGWFERRKSITGKETSQLEERNGCLGVIKLVSKWG